MLQNLGHLEKRVLLIVTIVREVCGLSVAQVYGQPTGRGISMLAIHALMKRLEKKGVVKSAMKEAGPKCRGCRKPMSVPLSHAYKIVGNLRQRRLQLSPFVLTLDRQHG